MLEMLKWLYDQLMEAELSSKLGAGKSERTDKRKSYRSGHRPRRFDTHLGTMYLMVPRPRKGGYIPFFVTECKRSEIAFMNVIQEAFINGVSTRKIEKVAKYVWLVVSDAHKGLVSAVKKSFIGASWQRCKVHFIEKYFGTYTNLNRKNFLAEN